ncbi:MBL fold metallo-hydrolase [Candidatus Shapirobacteria bacterium]|nr:MBL fold metallo-hydrolase [Candidatus Shapirobacteria bacterium]
MEIWYLGHSCFRLRARNGVIVTDPHDPQIGFKMPRVSADIVTISHDHFDHNRSDLVEGSPKVLRWPGEYEIKEIFITGLPSYHDKQRGQERGENVIFLFETEKIKICHLGDLGEKPTARVLETIHSADILFLPVGGTFTLSPQEAASLAKELEPKIVIPMHYQVPELVGNLKEKLSPLSEFEKAWGQKLEILSKLNITPDDLLLSEGARVVALERR